MIRTIFRFNSENESQNKVDFECIMPIRFNAGDNFDFDNFPFKTLDVSGFSGNYCYADLVRFEYAKSGEFIQIVFVKEC
jgi:hypothetical protein